MRIADKMNFSQVIQNLGKNRTKMADLQNQAATQKRVTKPSDDPVAAARTLGKRVDLSGNKQFLKNLNYAKSFLEFTDQSLNEVTAQLVRAKELAISQSNDASANAQSRRITSAEIDQIYDQVVNVGNRKMGDRYIFGGYKTTKSPFDVTGKYSGDDGEMLIGVEKGSFVSMNIPGSRVFIGSNLSRDGISHSTTTQAKTVEEFDEQKLQERQAQEQQAAEVRGPATINQYQRELGLPTGGLNIFDTIKNLSISLKTNSKTGVQESLEKIDEALSQVVMARSQVGARVMALDSAMDTINKNNVDANTDISQLEDADVFKVVNDINQTETQLKATLQTSGKLITPSLLDFLR